MKKTKLAALVAALALPALLATSAFAQDKMTGSKPKMSGGKMMRNKMMGGKMVSVKGLVPVTGKMPSKGQMMGAKVVSTMMMHGKPCYTVRLRNGKTIQMCKAADVKMMGHMGGKMMGGKMSGGKMMGDHKMGGKM